MRDPRAVEAVAALALLVVAHLGDGCGVDLRVTAARDERGHPADGMRAAPVARPHEQLGVGAHERHGHRQLRAIRQDERRVVAELLDRAEQVVPAARVEPRGVLAQLVQDLVHLERGVDRLDEDGRPDRAARDAQRFLGVDEHLVPQARLVVRLELGEVEVRARAAARALGGVVEQVQAGVEQRGGDRLAVDEDVGLDQVPAARSDEQASRAARRGGTTCPPADSNASVPRTASARAACPPTTFAQLGDSASSRSAMNTRAPELSALIIIFGSAGPVISTRRSSRSAGAGATDQSAARTSAVSGRKPSCRPPARIALSRSWRRSRRSSRSGPNRRWRSATNASASSVRMRSLPGTAPP